MTEYGRKEARISFFVKSLIDRWNVGIREGEIHHTSIERWEISRIQSILQNLGVTVCLENVDAIRERWYDNRIVSKESTTNLKFIMTEVTEYPF